MKDWRNSGVRNLIDQKEGCRHCLTSRGLKKIKDAVSKTKERFVELWNKRMKKK